MIIIVMGVSGSGKTTVGELLARRLGWEFADADEFHSPANIAKMHAGHPLSDADRASWLAGIAAWIDEHIAAGKPGVVTCSALKRAYRDRLRRSEERLVYLEGDRDLIASRIGHRHGHFFPAKLLDSQLRELEPPGPDEHPITVPVAETPEESVRQIIDRLDLDAR
ncbi:MAG TPA: gluconokinase [Streptosporangiaceae bacterium]|jgi:gluconokinase